MMNAITQSNRQQIGEHGEALQKTLPDELRAKPLPSISDIIATRQIRGYLDCLSQQFQHEQKNMLDKMGEGVCDAFNRLTLISLLNDFDPQPFVPAAAPDWLHESYVDRANFIAHRVLTAPVGEYTALAENFVKDLRILGGVSYPSYHNVVDWEAYLPRTFYRYKGWRENLRNLSFIAFRAHGLGPYLRGHIDLRFRELRRENGPMPGRLHSAQILQSCPWILGTIGTSWMSDPALEWVSPLLWERGAVDRANGLYLKRDGFNEVDLERALRTSRRRRQLYAEGKYQPCAYTTVWCRKDYIRWYEKATANDAIEKPASTPL